MLKSLGVLLIAAAILYFEVPPLLEKKDKKELLLFLIILLIGVGLSITLAFKKTIPNPLDFLTFVLKPINDLISLLVK